MSTSPMIEPIALRAAGTAKWYSPEAENLKALPTPKKQIDGVVFESFTNE